MDLSAHIGSLTARSASTNISGQGLEAGAVLPRPWTIPFHTSNGAITAPEPRLSGMFSQPATFPMNGLLRSSTVSQDGSATPIFSPTLPFPGIVGHQLEPISPMDSAAVENINWQALEEDLIQLFSAATFDTTNAPTPVGLSSDPQTVSHLSTVSVRCSCEIYSILRPTMDRLWAAALALLPTLIRFCPSPAHCLQCTQATAISPMSLLRPL